MRSPVLRLAALLAVAALPAAAQGARAAAVERWQAVSTTATSITGDITLAPDRITFANGRSLQLTALGRSSTFSVDGRRVAADLYRVVVPADPELLRGNRLCGRGPVTYLAVWQPPRAGSDIDPRSVAVFSGRERPTGTSARDLCGTFTFEAGRRR